MKRTRFKEEQIIAILKDAEAGEMPANDLAAHKLAGARDAIHAIGAEVRYLLPYSPDFNPIEMASSKLKAFLKKIAARSKNDLWHAVGIGIDTFTPLECEHYFAAAGYDRE